MGHQDHHVCALVARSSRPADRALQQRGEAEILHVGRQRGGPRAGRGQTDQPDPDPLPLDDDPRVDVGPKRACTLMVLDVRREHRKTRRPEPGLQRAAAVASSGGRTDGAEVELVVAEDRRVVAQSGHQLGHREPLEGVGEQGPLEHVAAVEQDRPPRVPTPQLGDGGGQRLGAAHRDGAPRRLTGLQGHRLELSVEVVGGQQLQGDELRRRPGRRCARLLLGSRAGHEGDCQREEGGAAVHVARV